MPLTTTFVPAGRLRTAENMVASPASVWPAARKRPARAKSARYTGSLVADFHRNLLVGGVFCYPPDDRSPQGKLRLLYEANPMGKLVHEAGGAVSTGTGNILDLQPSAISQVTPIYIGGKKEIALIEKYMREG